MTLAETPSTTLQKVHPGGFFWKVERGQRLTNVVRLAAHTQKLVIITNTVREAENFGERLTLSGVPVHVAVDPLSSSAIDGYRADVLSTLVATQEYLVAHEPTAATMVVHVRAALSVRDYTKRLYAVPSSVHLSFIVPEDERRALSLSSHFRNDHGHGKPSSVDIEQVIDLTDSDVPAMVSHARRRFPLGR